MTKKTLLCGAAVLAIAAVTAGPVAAADASMWTGPYVGLDVGYGDMNVSGRFNPSELPGDPWDNDSGFVGGGHIGYNMGMEGFLIGVEADLMLTDFKTDACNACVNGSETADAEIDFLASLRARIGVLMMDNRALLYGTGGVAYRDASWSASAEGLDGKDSLNDFGGVVGGGVEFMVTDNISARIEGLYYFFPEGSAPSDWPPYQTTGSNIDANPIVGRIGVSIQF